MPGKSYHIYLIYPGNYHNQVTAIIINYHYYYQDYYNNYYSENGSTFMKLPSLSTSIVSISQVDSLFAAISSQQCKEDFFTPDLWWWHKVVPRLTKPLFCKERAVNISSYTPGTFYITFIVFICMMVWIIFVSLTILQLHKNYNYFILGWTSSFNTMPSWIMQGRWGEATEPNLQTSKVNNVIQ